MATVQGWSDLFIKCQDIGDAILQNLDVESSLACRLVCKDWRYVANNFKPLWCQLRTHDLSCRDHDACTEPHYWEYPDESDYQKAREQWLKCDTQMHKVRMTLLLDAVKKGHVLTTELLIHRGVSIRMGWWKSKLYASGSWVVEYPPYYDECKPIHTASKHGQAKMVQLLIDHGACDKAVKVKGSYSVSALHLAVENGHGDVVKVLLQGHNRCINERRTGGATPLFLAVEKGNITIVQLLLATKNKNTAGLSPDEVQDCIVDTEIANHSGRTPLHKAAELGRLEIAKLLVSAGANVNSGTDSKQKLTPLHLAARSGKKGAEVLKLLLSKGANVNALSQKNQTALDLARTANNRNILTKAKSDPAAFYASSTKRPLVKPRKDQDAGADGQELEPEVLEAMDWEPSSSEIRKQLRNFLG